MKIKSPALLGSIAVMAVGLLTQSFHAQKTAGPNNNTRLTNIEVDLARYLESDDEVTTTPAPSRPRRVERVSNVSASVIVNTSELSRTIFDLMNVKRLENGQKALVWSDDLARVANIHSENMAEYSFFSHRGLDNKMVSDRADQAHIGRWSAIGENIAYERGWGDPATKAIQLWMDSPSHRQNMLSSDWKQSAVAVAVASDGSYYFTQVFLKK